jgi:ParB-like chromosome segregation protein Spo0J
MAIKNHPVHNIQWIPIERIQSNDYNPNSVARNEMKLLYLSIKEDGYTQPIVTIFDPDIDKYVIIDGFHRYSIARLNPDVLESTEGTVPCVVLSKNINQRMASTVRHNRARGKHSVAGMANMVFSMLDNGMTDDEVCNKLGLEIDELLRLKHVTGFSKLFENTEYKTAWMKRKQVQIRKKRKDEVGDGFKG